jgi:hypothetical protein
MEKEGSLPWLGMGTQCMPYLTFTALAPSSKLTKGALADASKQVMQTMVAEMVKVPEHERALTPFDLTSSKLLTN